MNRPRLILGAAFALLALAGVLWTTTLLVSGGVNVTIAGVRVSSNNPWRPGIGTLLSTVLFVTTLGVSGARAWIGRATAACTPMRTAVTLAFLTVCVSVAGNSWTASGPDSYAYVSQAAMWRSGALQLPVPLAKDAPWPNAVATFATPGYRPAPGGGAALVPVTAPGLPMLMAALQSIGGHAAAFVITPIAGGILVLMTFLIGRRVDTPRTGLIAAWLVATSPAALFMLMWPMTDVPTAAVTALMTWCLLGASSGSAVGAGLAAAAGLLLRPNFAVIAAAAWLWLLLDTIVLTRDAVRWKRLAAFTLAAAPGEVVVAVVNMRWYGSPLASGYGSVNGLLSLHRVTANLTHYTQWLAGSSPVALLGLVALAVPFSRVWPSPVARRAALLLLLTTVAAWSVYLVYGEFVDWWYLRFLLPAWPAIFVATAMVIGLLWRRAGIARTIAVMLILACGISGIAVARDRWVFNLGPTERRYATIAHLVDVYTEPGAVILTSQHAGTIRYYAGRETLRFDFLDPAWLDRSLAWLAANGHHPYVLLEDWERPLFEARFEKDTGLARLPFPPVLVWHSKHTPGEVMLYDPLRRDGSTADPGPDIEDALPRSASPVAR